jgi:hypothetical protein
VISVVSPSRHGGSDLALPERDIECLRRCGDRRRGSGYINNVRTVIDAALSTCKDLGGAMSKRRKRSRDQPREPAPGSAEVFAWAAQIHRAADLVEEFAAGREMTVREVLAEMPDGPEREELISLLSLPPVAARLGVPMGVVDISPGPTLRSHPGEAMIAPNARRDPATDQAGEK